MLAADKLKNLLELINSSTSEELIWMNGYLNGIVSGTSEKKENVTKPAVNKITITYGTETGNSKKIATDFAAKAKKSGINVKLVSLDQYRLNDLPKEEYFFTVVSTHGDGEPPVATKKFYEHIHNNGFRFEKLKYSVLALGDTSYPLFCKTGEDIDEQLNKLGGIRLAPLKKCDVEFDDEAKQWLDKVFETLSTPSQVPVLPSAVPEVKKTSAKKAYTGNVLSNIVLNDRGSQKHTFHMELAVDIPEYEPGDSIGIVPENKNSAVEEIISLTGIDRNKEIEYRNEWFTVADLLKKRVSIIQLAPSVVKKYAALAGGIQIPERKTDLADLIKSYPPKDVAQSEEIISILNPIAPRLYTIASSPLSHTDEIHITVKKDEFDVNGQLKFGLCSEYISEIKPDDEISFFVQKNKRFRLPADDKDIIMIGPGTGIAAFRSFLAERDAKNATGKNWLFFGEQHFVTDFLYQTEIQNWFETGVLTKVNTAFSRDQPERIYVQHRMMQHGAEFFEWLNSGSYVYVCGTKDPMSIDVEKTLLQIIEKFGGMTSEQARQYLTSMKEEGRYMKDVY